MILENPGTSISNTAKTDNSIQFNNYYLKISRTTDKYYSLSIGLTIHGT